MVNQLQGPNFERVTISSFDIDGTHLYIPIPEECNGDTQTADSKVEALDCDSTYDVRDPSYFLIKYLLKSTFRYAAIGNELEVGRVRIEADLLKVDLLRPQIFKTNFSQDDFIGFYFSILKDDECTYIASINDKEKTDKYLVIPKSIEEIKELKFEGASWLFAVSGYAEVTKPYRRFITPITNNHILSIMVSIGGFDFGSVELEQELVAEVDQYILDFIKSIRIDYSPETLAEIQRVRGDVTA